jgi:hypothetical protein
MPEYLDPEIVQGDPRGWRKTARFGREKAGKVRHIHEETLSFLLVGHFKDVGTCYQLEESYYRSASGKDLGTRSFRPYSSEQSPAMLLLSWIMVSLHHVSWRWETAISAVDSEITSPVSIHEAVYLTLRHG